LKEKDNKKPVFFNGQLITDKISPICISSITNQNRLSRVINNQNLGRSCEEFMKEKIKIIKGDITKVKTEAIVNAANETLLGGGGVDGAIHQAAGPKLLKECRQLGGCETGEAKITKGYNLPAKYIIHTVGPIWQGGDQDEEEKLANCYRNSLKLAAGNKIKSIAFPSISTGVYGFPIEKAAPIALKEVKKFLEGNDVIKEVIFVLFSDKDFQIYQNLGRSRGNLIKIEELIKK